MRGVPRAGAGSRRVVTGSRLQRRPQPPALSGPLVLIERPIDNAAGLVSTYGTSHSASGLAVRGVNHGVPTFAETPVAYRSDEAKHPFRPKHLSRVPRPVVGVLAELSGERTVRRSREPLVDLAGLDVVGEPQCYDALEPLSQSAERKARRVGVECVFHVAEAA